MRIDIRVHTDQITPNDQAIFAALERASRGAAHRSVKSYNNHVGVPLSLARMPASSRPGTRSAAAT